MNTPHHILRGELIGKDATIVRATNTHRCSYHGTIIDETRNILTFDDGKKFHKNTIMLRIQYATTTYDINGKDLIGKPEDRLKK